METVPEGSLKTAEQKGGFRGGCVGCNLCQDFPASLALFRCLVNLDEPVGWKLFPIYLKQRDQKIKPAKSTTSEIDLRIKFGF